MKTKPTITFDLGDVSNYQQLYAEGGGLDPMTQAIILGCFLAGLPLITQQTANVVFIRLRMLELANGPLCTMKVTVQGEAGPEEREAFREVTLVDVFRHVGLSVKTRPLGAKELSKLLTGYLVRRAEADLHVQGKKLVEATKAIKFPSEGKPIVVIEDESQGDASPKIETPDFSKPPEVAQEVGQALLDANAEAKEQKEKPPE